MTRSKTVVGTKRGGLSLGTASLLLRHRSRVVLSEAIDPVP